MRNWPNTRPSFEHSVDDMAADSLFVSLDRWRWHFLRHRCASAIRKVRFRAKRSAAFGKRI